MTAKPASEFAQTSIAAPGITGVDWEERVEFNRLREYRITRARQALEKSDLGALLVFESNNIRYLTATHIFSDRFLRPGDRAFFDILHSFNGYRTCYYRTFAVGSASRAQHDGYRRAREYMDRAIALVRLGATTADICAVWPKAEEIEFLDEEAVRSAVRARRRPVDLGEADLLQARLLRAPRGPRGGHGVRPGELLAFCRRHRCRSDGGRVRGHPRRLLGDYEVPCRGSHRGRAALLHRRWAVAHSAWLPEPQEHTVGPRRGVMPP